MTTKEVLTELSLIAESRKGTPSWDCQMWAKYAFGKRKDRDELRRVAGAAIILSLPFDEFAGLPESLTHRIMEFANSAALFALLLLPGIAGAAEGGK